MPERILRDLTDSEAYNAAPVHARDLFIRLMNKADDYGLYLADARRLRPLLYPLLLEQVREADLPRWTAECAKAGLVRLYTIEGREYLQVCRWGKQRLRNKRAKFPAPPWGLGPHPDDPHRDRTADASHPPPDSDADSDADSDTPQPPACGGIAGKGVRRKPPRESRDERKDRTTNELAERLARKAAQKNGQGVHA
jgi:hypothetical protein